MQKVVVSAAERIAQLRVIPKQKLPQTLHREILLPNIKEFRLNYRPMCKNIGLSLQFVRQFGPALRFYNPDLRVAKTHSAEGPIIMEILVLRKEQSEPVKLMPNEYKSTEEILAALQKINDQA